MALCVTLKKCEFLWIGETRLTMTIHKGQIRVWIDGKKEIVVVRDQYGDEKRRFDKEAKLSGKPD